MRVFRSRRQRSDPNDVNRIPLSATAVAIRELPSKSARRPSKNDAILHLLRRKQGASLEEMQKASGWQNHSVRGYLSGTVKKRLGLKLNSSKSPNGERRYTIAAS